MAMLLSAARPRPKPEMIDTLREPPPAPVDAVGLTPAQVAAKRKIAEQLSKSATDYSPVAHWSQGLGRVVDAFASNLEESRASKAEAAGRESANTALQGFLAEDATADPKTKVARALALAQNPWLDEVSRGVVMQQAIPKEPEQTGTMKEYDWAVQNGFKGSPMDYQMQLSMARGGLVPNQQQPGAFTPVPGGPADPTMKPPPVGVQNKEDEDIDAINASNSMNNTIEDITKRLDEKKLDLGFFSNMIASGRNVAGMSTPESVEYATFTQNLKKMQNDILMLHNGVQTEGDAMRALQQIVTNPTDNEVVKANLKELKRLNDIALGQRRQKIDLRRERNRMAPIDPADIGLPVAPPAAPPQPGQFTPTDGGTLAPVAAPQGGAPQPGMIEDGMRFKGGNPADPNSWEPVAPAGGPEMTAPPGPQMAPPAAPDPYGLMDITRQREQMQRKPNHRMLLRGG